MRGLVAFTSLISFSVLSVLGSVTWDATPFNPASIPLAVRSPYFSAWLSQGAGTALNAAWPTFWTGSIVGWAGYAKVDGTAYNWLGVPAVPNVNVTKAVQKSFQFTSTQSTFVMTAGPVDLTITFLSPVEPSDMVNQSLPLSYYSISAASNDGKAHSVQVYADISGEWITGNNSLVATWNTTTGDVLTHEVQLDSQSQFTEINDRIQQGSAFHATLNNMGATYQTGEDIVVRAQFINNGSLANTQDSTFRAVQDRWPIFAFAHDLGSVTDASAPSVFVIGVARDPALQYLTPNGQIQDRSTYFWSKYSSMGDAISVFLNDYTNAVERAQSFDAQVQADADKISSDYTGLVALSIRQTFGATEITLSKNSDGTFNTSDVMTFMKEISSSGDVSTVDIMFPSWPLFLYTNPTLGKQLLLPLLEYQASGQYPNKYSVHDMGSHYPNATGHNDGKDEAMPVEESGNMLIMTMSYTKKTNDTSLVKTYYNLLDQWTQFLIADSLIPENQFSTDDFAGELANQTNLAIKGIIGIKAMAQIAGLMGDPTRSSNYSSIVDSYLKQWETFATSTDKSHLTLSYGNSTSWGLTYNMYADKLLGTNIFPQAIYDMQTSWYGGKANTYGVPLDTRHAYTKSDWQIWTAGIVTSESVRNLLISSVVRYVSDAKNGQPLGDLYDSITGVQVQNSGHARPVVGGHLALLALDPAELVVSNTSSTTTQSTISTSMIPTSAAPTDVIPTVTIPTTSTSTSSLNPTSPSSAQGMLDRLKMGCATVLLATVLLL